MKVFTRKKGQAIEIGDSIIILVDNSGEHVKTGDDRLEAVAEHVRTWLFGKKK